MMLEVNMIQPVFWLLGIRFFACFLLFSFPFSRCYTLQSLLSVFFYGLDIKEAVHRVTLHDLTQVLHIFDRLMLLYTDFVNNQISDICDIYRD